MVIIQFKRLVRFTCRLQEIKQWRQELRVLLDEIQRDLEYRNEVTSNLEHLSSDIRLIAERLSALETEFETTKIFSEQKSRTRNSNEKDLLRLASLTLEMKQIKHIALESEDKCDKLEKVVNQAADDVTQSKQDLIDLKSHLMLQHKMSAIVTQNGHFIWRIDQFSQHFQEAKDRNVLISSPIFCNEPFGYTFQVKLVISLPAIFNQIACLFLVRSCAQRLWRLERTKHSGQFECDSWRLG